MKSIKNKQKQKAKIILTSSSLLLLNAHQTGCWRSGSEKLNASQAVKQITQENKIATPNTKHILPNTSTTQAYQDSGYESGYESDNQQVSCRKVYYEEPLSNMHTNQNDTMPNACKHNKDDSSLRIQENSNTTNNELSSNNIPKEVRDRTIDDGSKHSHTTNDHQDSEFYRDQGYGSTSNLSSNHTNQPIIDQDPELEQEHIYEIPDMLRNGENTYSDFTYAPHNYKNTYSDPRYEQPNNCFKQNNDNLPKSDNNEDKEHAYTELIHKNDRTYNTSTNEERIDEQVKEYQPTKREATKPIELITEDVKSITCEIYKRSPSSKLTQSIQKLMNGLITIEETINEIVAMREGADNLLTEQQKQMLREIKTTIQATNSPVSTFNQINELLNRSKASKEAIKKQAEEAIKQIKKHKKAIKPMLAKTNKLKSSISKNNTNQSHPIVDNRSSLSEEIPFTDL